MTRLEHSIGVALRVGVLISSVCLALGLAFSLWGGGPSVAGLLLQAGIVVLLCTPVTRVVISTVEYVAARDWQFATLTAIVLIELLASAIAVLVFNRKL